MDAILTPLDGTTARRPPIGNDPFIKYGNLDEFIVAHPRLRLRFAESTDWRLTDRHQGEIIGLPQSRGILTATNGIDCVIEQPDGSLFEGHLAWFITDKKERVVFDSNTGRTSTKPLEPRQQAFRRQLIADLLD